LLRVDRERNIWYQSHLPTTKFFFRIIHQSGRSLPFNASMEEQSKLLADLTATISAMNAKLDEMHPVVLDLHAWKPMVERSMEAMRAEMGDLRAQINTTTRSTSSSPRGPDLPPLLHTPADAPPVLHTPPKPGAYALDAEAPERGDNGHGQVGHRDASNSRGGLSGDRVSLDGA
jgi:hypothetical protein